MSLDLCFWLPIYWFTNSTTSRELDLLGCTCMIIMSLYPVCTIIAYYVLALDYNYTTIHCTASIDTAVCEFDALFR